MKYYGLNSEPANIMHIDLNSCFATIEQQAHPSLRGQAVGITNRLVPHCCLITCSYEAKALGVRVGMRYEEARLLAPKLIMLESDPAKYHFVYTKLIHIMQSYSPKVKMKSIDEGVIDFHGVRPSIESRDMEDIGLEIKQRIRAEIGSWMKCNIGIAPNQFLAKLAAGLHKPDGMDRIDANNLIEVLQTLKLTDLPGIAEHYEARLNANQIYTPLQFLEADKHLLHQRVFRSISGEYWYDRLRGYEVDDVKTKKGIVGRQFVLDGQTNNQAKLLCRMQYLCQTTGLKLRNLSLDARGVAVWCDFANGEHFFKRQIHKVSFYTDKDIFERVIYLFNQRPQQLSVVRIGLFCYNLSPSKRNQLALLESFQKSENLTLAIDEVNQRHGNFTIIYAAAAEGKLAIKQKVPFGSTEYFDLLLRS